MRFKDFILLEAMMSIDRAMQVFDYNPGDMVDEKGLRTRLGRLTKLHHPDRGGEHAAMVDVNNAHEQLVKYVGQALPSPHQSYAYAGNTNNSNGNYGTDSSSWGTWQGANKSNYQEPKQDVPESLKVLKQQMARGLMDAADFATEVMNMRGDDQEIGYYKFFDKVNQIARTFQEWYEVNPQNKFELNPPYTFEIEPSDFDDLLTLINDNAAYRKKYRKVLEQARSKLWVLLSQCK